jgi:hypothetical protein
MILKEDFLAENWFLVWKLVSRYSTYRRLPDDFQVKNRIQSKALLPFIKEMAPKALYGQYLQ